jgi:chromate reductase
MKILAVPGSLRRESYNRMLLQAAAELLPEGVELELFEELKALPPYDEDDEWGPVPASVTRLREALAGADAVLFATPEYNHSIPGQLKNALDWISRPPGTSPLRNKPVAVVGASQGGFGAVWARPTCAACSPRSAHGCSTPSFRSPTPIRASIRTGR